MIDHLEFLNATAGRTFFRHRSDLREHAITFLQQGLQWNGWTVVEHTHALPPRTHTFELKLNGVSVSHCSLCLTEVSTLALWRHVERKKFYTVEASSPPKTIPWLAMHLLEGSFNLIINAPHRMLEMADLEAAMAWHIIDRHG